MDSIKLPSPFHIPFLLPLLALSLPPLSSPVALDKTNLDARVDPVSSTSAAELETRASTNATKYGDVDVTGFPTCAAANCIQSQQLSPSRLGCSDAVLTADCLCLRAPMPFECAPSGPSDENNCWYQMEDWLAGICAPVGGVSLVGAETVPPCAKACVFSQLSTMGCRNPTRNCLCVLTRQKIIDAVSSCVTQSCVTTLVPKMVPSFSAAAWRDELCMTGNTSQYDAGAFDAHVKMVRDTKIAVPIVVSLLAAFLAVVIVSVADDKEDGICGLITVIVVALAIILPVEFAAY